MQVYGSILPGAVTVAKLLPGQAAEARRQAAEARKEVRLSRTAQPKLKVILWHLGHGENISRTARHFGHSRTSVQACLKAYKAHGRAGLEAKSHRPHNVRQATWSSELERRVRELREQYPRWGKDTTPSGRINRLAISRRRSTSLNGAHSALERRWCTASPERIHGLDGARGKDYFQPNASSSAGRRRGSDGIAKATNREALR